MEQVANPASFSLRGSLAGRIPLLIGGGGMLVILLIALAAPLVAPYDPTTPDLASRLEAPSWAHWFGTDVLGRDVFSRVLYGAQTTLTIGFMVVFVALLIGVPVGMVAGYFGGKVDTVLMRTSEVFLAFPPLLLPIAITAALGPGLMNAMLALAVAWFPWYARIARSATISVREELFVSAARAVGMSHWRILGRHVLPNSLTPITVQASLDFGYTILAAAGLSFIGLGARPPAVDWGLMISESRALIIEYWWLATFPGLAIFFTVVLANLAGDGIRDWLDPNYRSNR